LKPVKISDLEYYIKKNTVFNLRPFFDKLPKQIRQQISDFAKNNRKLLKELLTAQNLIDQTKENRPDLYKVLITYQGRDWLERFMKYIQKVVLSL